MQFKRFLALFLALMLFVSLLPAVYADEAEKETVDDLWAQIYSLETSELALRGFGKRAASAADASDFAAMSKDVEKLVVASDSFKAGTITRHGDFFFWETVDGEACGYSPRLRAQMRKDAAEATADPEELSGIETVSFTRGGSAGSKDVAVFQPYYGIDSSFKTTYATEGTRIAKATGGTSTTYKTTSATIDQVAKALETCGVVIFDSHGDTDYANGEDYVTKANSSYLCMQTNTGWTTADQKAVTGPYGTYYHCWNAGSNGTMRYYEVDGTGFANHMSGNAKTNLLWMAICLGMATDGLHKPLREKGVEVVYGYSQSVSFDGDYDYEADFFTSLIDGKNVADAFAYMTRTYKWDPAYASSSQYNTIGKARYNYVAFPNVVSSEDTYQGHRTVNPSSASAANSTAYNAQYGACNLQTVKSTWTLFSQYTVTAVSNNTAWGTVSVSGSTITASPKTGYYAAGYEVTSGTASVTQDGNTFTVTPESDCTVQINFAAKTPATVSFVTPDGVSCAAINAYVGDEITLPSPTGTPTADAQEYRFLGWTGAKLSDTTERPAYTPAGGKVTLTGSVTYYALYAYAVADGGSTVGFKQLTAAPADWSGEYVLTYNSTIVLDASGKYTGAEIGSKDAALALADAGITLSGGVLDATDDYVYVIEPSTVTSGAYTLRMKNSGNYLAYNTNNTNAVSTAASAKDVTTDWNLSFSGSTVSIVSVNSLSQPNTRYLQYNTTAKVFRCYTGGQKNLTLFSGKSGTGYYTTELGNSTACQHTYVAVVTAPTCTDKGYTTYTCSKCGDSYTADETAALGHAWDAGVVTLEPTEDAEGVRTFTCTRCGETKTEAIPKSDHEHDYQAVVTPPTCTEKGYTTYTCSKCGDSYKADYVDALGHDYQAVVTAPTCTEKGYTTYTCSKCGDTYTGNETAALGHDFVDGVCSRCGEKDPDYKPDEPQPINNPFEDVSEDAYYFEPVMWAVETGVTGGTDETHFSPNKPCTRAQVVTFLYAAAGKPSLSSGGDNETDILTENPFVDVSGSAYYHDAVLWAFSKGITGGVDKTHFGPNKTCTRAQVVTFLYSWKNKPAYSATENPFDDVAKTAYYYDAVMWAVENGVTGGTGNRTFSPNKSCTRCQVVTFLYKAK